MTITRDEALAHIAALTNLSPSTIEQQLTAGASFTIDRDHPNGTWNQ